MAIVYKCDILQSLKDNGYNTNRLRKEKIFGEAVIQKLRQKELVSWSNIDKICKLLQCQPGDIVKYVPDSKLI